MLVYVRPSNEALLRARVPGAQDQRGCPSHPFHRGASASKKDSLATPLSSVSPISPGNARYRTTQWDSEIEAHLLYAIVETAT